ncbi:hypothetical protein C8F04DRAFT_1401554, partial [Mycena alexandri]
MSLRGTLSKPLSSMRRILHPGLGLHIPSFRRGHRLFYLPLTPHFPTRWHHRLVRRTYLDTPSLVSFSGRSCLCSCSTPPTALLCSGCPGSSRTCGRVVLARRYYFPSALPLFTLFFLLSGGRQPHRCSFLFYFYFLMGQGDRGPHYTAHGFFCAAAAPAPFELVVSVVW